MTNHDSLSCSATLVTPADRLQGARHALAKLSSQRILAEEFLNADLD